MKSPPSAVRSQPKCSCRSKYQGPGSMVDGIQASDWPRYSHMPTSMPRSAGSSRERLDCLLDVPLGHSLALKTVQRVRPVGERGS